MKSARHLIFSIVSISIGIFLLTIALAFSYFYINQENLKKQIVQFVNNSVLAEIEDQLYKVPIFAQN